MGFLEGAGAVGDAVFHFGIQLGKGFGVAVGHKERVVAESVGAAQFIDNDAGAFTRNGLDASTGIRKGDDGAEASGAVFLIGQFVEQLFVVGGIGAGFAGVAGGIDAGRAVEGVDLEAGVVGQRPAAGGLGKGATDIRGEAFWI